MFFIVSTGRSGTMTIARVLSQINDCVCFHEPSPELILESSAYRYGDFSKKKLKEVLLNTRKPSVNGSVYCESNQTLSLIIPVLAETFPEARYIWLIRNGLDVVASAYQKQWYTGHSENQARYEDCSPIAKAWIDGRIRGDQCGDMSYSEWADLDRFARCCWYWGYINRVIEKDLNKYAPGRFYLLRLEEMDKKLRDVLKWMDLKAKILPLAEPFNRAKRQPYHWTCWSLDKRKTFDRFCGKLMDQFYTSWKTCTEEWKCVNYYSYKGPLRRIKSNPKLIKKINDLFILK